MTSRRRVVITGIGVITSLADSACELVNALREMRSGIRPISRWDASAFPVRFGGECTNFDITTWGIDAREARRMDRFAQFGLAAAIGAFRHSGVELKTLDPARCGVMIGSGVGGLETIQDQYRILLERGVGRMSPFTVPRLMANAAAANVSIHLGFQGPNNVVSTACSTGSNAIGDAARSIQAGQADVMIAGGAEAALCELGLGSFCAARALSTRNDDPTRASRPWDVDREGFVLSEGAAVVVLEDYERAKGRSARIYAEVLGYGQTADAHHITSPHPEGVGAAAAMRLAIEDAELATSQINYIHAHGTSTQLGDLAETHAINEVFGRESRRLMVSSTKGQTGHLCAAAGSLGIAATALAMDAGFIPATANLEKAGEGCELDYVPREPRSAAIAHALVNSFGFGGHNTSIVLGKV